jgi:D-alanyl-lipoteichoic acid acyltransferase DltB (MBOAT superfamily)
MLFNSFEFLLFFVLVTPLYWVFPQTVKWFFLLASSMVFYMSWKPEYILLLLVSCSVDYLAALYLEKTQNERARTGLLALSLTVNFGILFFFKYFNFFSNNLTAALHIAGVNQALLPTFELILPLGVSFYTFEAVSYIWDVYRRKLNAERHYGYYLLFIMFYPKLIAGPIERAAHLLPQLKPTPVFDPALAVSGLRLMLWGFFKKVVVADRLAIVVNQVFNNIEYYDGLIVVLAVYFFTIQIYCDFSGYTDIARGAARLLGIRLLDNFNTPYFSLSIQEFWRRWHISLSTWFRDYLYIPLGGNRVSAQRQYWNVFIVFLVSGFWHGANWTFIVWGGLHGTYQITEQLLKPVRQKWSLANQHGYRRYAYVLFHWALTFHLVAFAWIFFRAESLSTAVEVISRLSWAVQGEQFATIRFETFFDPALEWKLCVLFPALLFIVDFLQKDKGLDALLTPLGRPVRWFAYHLAVVMIAVFGILGQQQFIYFEF